mgnify:CR=1 FL=1
MRRQRCARRCHLYDQENDQKGGGPSIRGVARQYTAYNNGIPQGLKEAAEKNKILAALIVPLEELPEAMRQLRQKSGRIYTLYQAVQGKT